MIRRFRASILAAALLAAAARAAPPPTQPDGRLTPGAVATTDRARVCARGYSRTVRHTSARLKAAVYRSYGVDPQSGDFKIDHRVPIELGGADVTANLWPESGEPAHQKDLLENKLRRLVCAGKMPLTDAQAVFLGDWRGAYPRFLGR